jgi:hypothetical protein
MAVYLLQPVAWTACLDGLRWAMTGNAMIEHQHRVDRRVLERDQVGSSYISC